MTGIYLLLGSNLGDRENHLRKAIDLINRQVGSVISESDIYTTEAWGMEQAPPFLNQIVVIDTSMSPIRVLREVLKIEQKLGRIRKPGYQNRTIDIDILYYNDLVVGLPELSIPHPRIKERRFVLQPLTDLAPDFVHPVLGSTNRQLLQECPDLLGVKPFEILSDS